MDFLNKSNNNRRPGQRQQSVLLTAVSTAALLSVCSIGAAHAEIANGPDMLLSDLAPVTDAELDKNRGGFSIGNISLWVGMTVTTTIQGASPSPISVTTNFTVDTPGQLTDLGSQISGDVATQVGNTLADVGIGSGSNNSSKNAAPASQQVADNTPPPAGTQQNNAQQVQSPPPPPAPTGDTKIVDNTPPAGFSAKLDPTTNSLNLTNNAGTNVNVSAVHGLLTTITNNLSGVTVQTQVDLNYVVQNYTNLVANGQNFQHALSLAQQMLSIHGIAGH